MRAKSIRQAVHGGLQDRHPCARAAEIDCALGAWPRGRTLPDSTPPSGLPRADLCRGGRPVESVLAVLSSLTASTAGSYRAPHRGVTRAEMRRDSDMFTVKMSFSA